MQEIADKLREEGVCDLTRQTVHDYVVNLRQDPDMQVAMDLAAKRMVTQGATTVTTISNEQMESFRRILTTTLGKLEAILGEHDGDLTLAFPVNEGESNMQYKARMLAMKALFENIPKLDARLESWSKFVASLKGVDALSSAAYTSGSGEPVSQTNITLNVTNLTVQYQRIMLDFLSWLPSDKQSMFREKLAELQAQA